MSHQQSCSIVGGLAAAAVLCSVATSGLGRRRRPGSRGLRQWLRGESRFRCDALHAEHEAQWAGARPGLLAASESCSTPPVPRSSRRDDGPPCLAAALQRVGSGFRKAACGCSANRQPLSGGSWRVGGSGGGGSRVLAHRGGG